MTQHLKVGDRVRIVRCKEHPNWSDNPREFVIGHVEESCVRSEAGHWAINCCLQRVEEEPALAVGDRVRIKACDQHRFNSKADGVEFTIRGFRSEFPLDDRGASWCRACLQLTEPIEKIVEEEPKLWPPDRAEGAENVLGLASDPAGYRRRPEAEEPAPEDDPAKLAVGWEPDDDGDCVRWRSPASMAEANAFRVDSSSPEVWHENYQPCDPPEGYVEDEPEAQWPENGTWWTHKSKTGQVVRFVQVRDDAAVVEQWHTSRNYLMDSHGMAYINSPRRWLNVFEPCDAPEEYREDIYIEPPKLFKMLALQPVIRDERTPGKFINPEEETMYFTPEQEKMLAHMLQQEDTKTKRKARRRKVAKYGAVGSLTAFPWAVLLPFCMWPETVGPWLKMATEWMR